MYRLFEFIFQSIFYYTEKVRSICEKNGRYGGLVVKAGETVRSNPGQNNF